MSFTRSSLFLAAAIAALQAISMSEVSAHCFVGARFLPATLNTDDPCVADEMSLPTVAMFKTGDDPAAKETDLSFDVSKRITENFGISVSQTWSTIRAPGMPSVSGWQNLGTAFQYQVLKDASHEFALLAGIVVDWGMTGSNAVGVDRFSTITPTLYFGKGFGDLPDSAGWFRAFAVTGEAGYSSPTMRTSAVVDPNSGITSLQNNPNFFVYSGSLQFSMPYLKSNVVDLGLPDFVNHLIPIVEAEFQTPVANNFATGIGTTGTVNPGVIWIGDYFQVGIEAIIPINRASGTSVGAMAQLHLYLDDIFPTTIGRPLLGSSSGPSKLATGN
jgi:hypothetical protein